MNMIVNRLLHLNSVRESLNSRLRAAQIILVFLMLIPAVVSICLMMIFSSQYHSVITHMKKVSSLMPMIQDKLLIEMSEIWVGRTRFEDGQQYLILSETESLLDDLIKSNPASRIELEVARNTLGTLIGYVDKMGVQMTNDATVDENLLLLEEIRNVGNLFVEMLQEFIRAEIDFSAHASDNIQRVIRTTFFIELILLVATLLFAILAQRWLSKSISGPIDQLKHFAGQIASGELQQRAAPPEVKELKDLTQSLNTMAMKLEQLMAENTQEQQNLKKSELRALQAQITPHFLYNTLDAIIWLAESKRYGEVIEITGALSDFYRTSLNNGKDWISIAEERMHLDGYLTIMRVRYRDILKYKIHVDEELLPCPILKLSIQPLVENAIYHGIKNRRGGGLVEISIRTEGPMMRVEVRDNGAGMTKERLDEILRSLCDGAPPGNESGYGVYSVDKRIKLHYNQPEGLSIDSTKGEGTSVWFSVPVKKGFDHHV